MAPIFNILKIPQRSLLVRCVGKQLYPCHAEEEGYEFKAILDYKVRDNVSQRKKKSLSGLFFLINSTKVK